MLDFFRGTSVRLLDAGQRVSKADTGLCLSNPGAFAMGAVTPSLMPAADREPSEARRRPDSLVAYS